MLTWLVYDISKDKTRTKVAKRCLDYGLYRVQRSVYIGDIPPNRVTEVELLCRDLLDPETDSLFIFPMSRGDYDAVRVVGQGFDKALVADELLTKVV